MKFKKVITLGLGAVMAMGILAGCSKPAANEPTKPAETTKPAAGKVQGYKVGTYKAEGAVDERGWKPTVEITIGEDGKIAKVVYDEVDKDGKKKSADEAYATNMKAKTNITPKEAYDKVTASLVATQDVSKTDAVSGATHAVDNFKTLAAKALEAAK